MLKEIAHKVLDGIGEEFAKVMVGIVILICAILLVFTADMTDAQDNNLPCHTLVLDLFQCEWGEIRITFKNNTLLQIVAGDVNVGFQFWEGFQIWTPNFEILVSSGGWSWTTRRRFPPNIMGR